MLTRRNTGDGSQPVALGTGNLDVIRGFFPWCLLNDTLNERLAFHGTKGGVLQSISMQLFMRRLMMMASPIRLEWVAVGRCWTVHPVSLPEDLRSGALKPRRPAAAFLVLHLINVSPAVPTAGNVLMPVATTMAVIS